ncbi:hypothetical protein OG218_03125 [Kineococcus sp. NBC_00420]|uniref:hypothetical protein n=1 Tax=Kineococcus sp. NBC_00420 TaxID=2903564 RepID=UPI002E20DAF1
MTTPDVVETTVADDDATLPDWSSAWDDALRSVELDVDRAELLIRAMHAGEEPSEGLPAHDWVAPAALGQVPHEFAERARVLLQRQLDVSERLAEAMIHARSRRRALGKFDPAERPPVFIDQAV